MIQGTERIRTHQKILFGAGDLAGCLSNTIISFFYLFYLTDIVGLRPALAGTVVLIGRVWDAFTDPLLGNISDRTKSRWGRRRVYLLFGSLPLAFTFYLLWAISSNLNQTQMFIYATLTYILHMTALTIVMVPYQTLTAEMTSDYDERTSLTAYRMAFSIIGGLVAAAVPKMIVDGFSSRSMGFLVMGLLFAILIGFAPLFPFFGCRERGKVSYTQTSFLKNFRLILKNKPFRYVLIMFLVTWTAINLLQAMFIYFIKYWLDMEGLFNYILVTIFGVATLCIPFWVKSSSLLGKKKAYILGIGFLGLWILFIIFIQPGMVLLTFIIAALIGIGISAAHVIPHSIIPDSIDYGHIQTGGHQEGIYYGLVTFLQKVGTASAIGVSGWILDWAGYLPDTTQSTTVLWTIRILLGPVPGVLLLIGILCIYFYPIDKNYHQRMMKTKPVKGSSFYD